MMAIGAMQAIGEAGLEVPDDVAVVGYDDITIAGMSGGRMGSKAVSAASRERSRERSKDSIMHGGLKMANNPCRNRSGMPLGGIGAGKVDFCPNGKFTNCTASNNWDAPITGGGAGPVGDSPDGTGIRGAFLARYVEGAGAQVLRTSGCGPLRGLPEEEMEFDAVFPRATVAYPPLGGVALAVEAFSPFCLDEAPATRYRSSSLPAAVFRFTLTNRAEQRRRAAAAVSWENLVGLGGYAGVVINHTDCRACTPLAEDDLIGVRFHATKIQLNGRTTGEYTLLCRRAAEVDQSVYAGWDLESGGREAWESFARQGRFPTGEKKVDGAAIGFQFARLDGGAIAQAVELAPGETKVLDFVLSWYFPHLLSPGLPAIDYGHAYQNWFDSAAAVGREVLAKADALRARILRWQEALSSSNLPRWLIRKLGNDLAVLFTNTWYTRDYRFTMNESPTIMRGCAGTLDQRMASGGIFAMCFPGLAEAELREWAAQQIGDHDEGRFGSHWDCRTGRPDLVLDRAGAVRHDLGWDHLEGGELGTPGWALLHWPDLAPAFVLQCYNLGSWTGDEEFLRDLYPNLKRAMQFVARLDQDGDGVPDLWGPGCCTYDNEHFPYYGASSYIASLYLAGLRIAHRIAARFGDDAFSAYCRELAGRVRRTLEEKLWDKQRGYFISWRDESAPNWEGGPRPHADRSENCMVAQAAGEWLSGLFGIPPGVGRAQLDGALRRIYELNVVPVQGCPANEVMPDGRHSFSWLFYIETYFACTAAYWGMPDEALEALRRIDRAVTASQSPWDAPLVWEGPDNTEPGWGRWYMSNPASWFFLHALGGVSYNALDGVLKLDPKIPAAIGGGRELSNLPVFLPRAWLKLSARYAERHRELDLVLAQPIAGGGLPLQAVILRAPAGADTDSLQVFDGEGRDLSWHLNRETGEIAIAPGSVLTRAGDTLQLRLTWQDQTTQHLTKDEIAG